MQVDEDVARRRGIQSRLRPHRGAGHELGIQLLNDRREHQLHLGHGEPPPDATARASAKWEIRIGGPAVGALWRKTMRVEPLRIRPIRRQTMDYVDADGDGRPGWNFIARDDVILLRASI